MRQQDRKLQARGGVRPRDILGEIFGTGFTPLSYIIDVLISNLFITRTRAWTVSRKTWHKHLATRDMHRAKCVLHALAFSIIIHSRVHDARDRRARLFLR